MQHRIGYGKRQHDCGLLQFDFFYKTVYPQRLAASSAIAGAGTARWLRRDGAPWLSAMAMHVSTAQRNTRLRLCGQLMICRFRRASLPTWVHAHPPNLPISCHYTIPLRKSRPGKLAEVPLIFALVRAGAAPPPQQGFDRHLSLVVFSVTRSRLSGSAIRRATSIVAANCAVFAPFKPLTTRRAESGASASARSDPNFLRICRANSTALAP